MKTKNRWDYAREVAIGAAIVFCSNSGTAYADQGGTELEEVVVTALKREQSVQETPSTVSVLDADRLEQLQIRSFDAFPGVVAGFGFERTAGGNTVVTIRGVGTTSSGQSLEQSVASYINGVYSGGNLREFATPLYDLQRVEVFKGTQSGISGQNTSVGVINIVTQKPGDDFGGYIRGGYEFENDGYSAEGAVDVPVTDSLKVRLSGLYDDVGGWIRNVTTDRDLGGTETYSGRINATWDASDAVSVQLYAQYDDGEEIGSTLRPVDDPNGFIRSYFPDFEPHTPVTSAFGSRSSNGGDDGYEYDILRGSVTVDADLGGGFKLTAITAGTKIDDDLTVDVDQSPIDLLWFDQKSRYEQATQEIRIASPAEDQFNYIVGAWYRHADQDKTLISSVDLAPGVALVGNVPFQQKTNTYSVFADSGYKLNDQFTLGATVRYTTETKRGRISATGNNPTFPAAPLQKTKLTPDFVDGSVRLQYEPTAGFMAYALYAHGTKTGALIDLNPTATVVKPEKADTYEAGLKWTGARSVVNLSVYHMDISGYQDIFSVNQNGAIAFAAENRDLWTQGIELQADARVASQFRLGGTVVYMDSHDEAGGQGVRVPHWSLTANARYEIPLGSNGKMLALFANGFYRTSYFNRPATSPVRDLTKSPSEATVDVGVEFSQSDGGFNASLLVQNLTDNFQLNGVDLFALDPAVRSAALVPLRRIFLRLGYEF